MAFPFPGSLNGRKLGFCGALLFYALGLGVTLVLAQVMPVADMCNPGVPVLTGLLTLWLGAVSALAVLISFLLGNRTETMTGFIAAHLLVLGGLAVAVLGLTQGT